MGVLEQYAAQAKITGDIGDGLDKEYEATQRDVHRLAGASHWLKESTRGVSGLMDHIRKDFEEGKYENIDSKKVFDLLSEWNRKAVECLLNLSELKKAEALSNEGKLAGIKTSIDTIKKYHIAATTRAAQIVQAVESEEVPNEQALKEARKSRAIGEHPGPSPLDARRVEALKIAEAPQVTETPQKRNRKKANA